MNKCATDAVMEREKEPVACDDPDLVNWLRLIQSEYFEMPGMHLTRQQIQRLWGLDPKRCDVLLDTLERLKFLRRTEDQAYVRVCASA